MLSDPLLLRTQAYINGQWVDAATRATFPVANPADSQTSAAVPDMGAAETRQAIAAAHAAAPA